MEEASRDELCCKTCGKSLEHEQYAVQQVFKFYEGREQKLFDFALCLSCLEELKMQLSEESRQKTEAYQKERLQAILDQGFDPVELAQENRCSLSGQPLSEGREYQSTAVHFGARLLQEIKIGSVVMEELQGLLSPATREALDDFVNDNLGWPPELKALWSKEGVLL